jgi:tetratricopeptide (TPR) repeat protein
MQLTKAIYPLVLAAAMVVGCESATKPQKAPKAAMTEQWNAARAGVLGSLAQEQYKGGNLDKARASVDNAICLNPKNAQLHVLSGKIALEQGQLDLAEKELRQAQFTDPKIAEADYLCGVVYQRWQKHDVALGLYEDAARKEPAELAYVLACAESMIAMGRSDEALDLLKSKLDSFEHSPVIRDAIGQLLVGKGRYADAVVVLRQASILATDDLAVKEHLGLALYFNKQYRESSEILAKLVMNEKCGKRVDLHLALGNAYQQSGRLPEAKSCFETATQLSPGTPDAWVGLAKVSLERNDLSRAENSLKKAMTLDSSSAEPQLLLGYVRLRQNRLSDALPLFKKASALNQADTVSLCMVGYVYEKTGRAQQAIDCYAKALKLHPGDELATKLMASIDVNE